MSFRFNYLKVKEPNVAVASILYSVTLEPLKNEERGEDRRLRSGEELRDTEPDQIVPSDMSKTED